ncbi:MAG: ABC transporter substrate binding protein [Pseudomonadales bacterium]
MLCVICSAQSFAGSQPNLASKEILVLSSTQFPTAWTEETLEGIQAELSAALRPVQPVYEYLDGAMFSRHASAPQLAQSFKKKYPHGFAVLIATDGDALQFLIEHRVDIAPAAAIVFCRVRKLGDSELQGVDEVTGVTDYIPVRETLELIKSVHKAVTNIAVVMDSSTVGMQLREEFPTVKRFVVEEGLEITPIEDWSYEELDVALNELPAASVVLLATALRDNTGAQRTLDESIEFVMARTGVPVYTVWDISIQQGVLGGIVGTAMARGRNTARIALRIIRGESANNIPLFLLNSHVPIFDYAALKHHDVDVNALPSDAAILNEPPEYYQPNMLLVWLGSLVFVLQAAIIWSLVYNIRKRQRSEIQLRHSETRYRTLTELAPVGIFHSSADAGTLYYFNDTFRKITGLNPEDALSHHDFTGVHPDDLPKVKQAVDKMQQTHITERSEQRFVRADGSCAWIVADAAPEYDDNGNITGLIGTLTDVTELKQIQAKLQRERAYHAAVTETAAEGIITIDERSKVRSFNRAAENMFGYAANEVIGNNITMLMPAPYHDAHENYIARYLSTGEKRIIGTGREVSGRHKSGEQFPLYLAVSEVNIEGERSFTGIMRDVSQVRAVQEELLLKNEQLEVLVNQAPLGITASHLNGEILQANKVFCDMTGYSLAELNELSTLDISHPKDWKEIMQLTQAAANGEILHFQRQGRYIKKNGDELHVEIFNAVTHDEWGKPHLLIGQVMDLTERLQTEQLNRANQERLAHVARLSMLGEMSAGIAHEINQPLTAISVYADSGLRLLEAKKIDRLPDVLEKLATQARRAGAVIERVQKLARRQAPAREMIDCNALLVEVCKMVEKDASVRNIELQLDLEQALPMVYCDAVQIQQVMLNLLRNGMEAVKEGRGGSGGEITIATECIANEVEVLVCDNGTGVSAELAEALFEPFATNKDQGMGMGLSISRAIVEAHGGELRFANNIDAGATFCFTLPTN